MKTVSAFLLALGTVALSVMSTPTGENKGKVADAVSSVLNKRKDVGALYYYNAKTGEENNMQCTPCKCLKIPGRTKGVTSSCKKNAKLYRKASCTGKFVLVKPLDQLSFKKTYSYVKFQ
ncbi:hypothetical protein BGZ72_008867 [Mortierella alpina]|nr:hypothetical protein BGZ72_008867 [Mortierella alpina]